MRSHSDETDQQHRKQENKENQRENRYLEVEDPLFRVRDEHHGETLFALLMDLLEKRQKALPKDPQPFTQAVHDLVF
jgi:hypothetical protein